MALINTGKRPEPRPNARVIGPPSKSQAAELVKKRRRRADPRISETPHDIDEARIDAALANTRGDRKTAIEYLRKAVAAEDKLPYSEPPLSVWPVRESLGGQLLLDGQFAEAETVFREDLQHNKGSGRAYFGWMKALEGQQKCGKRPPRFHDRVEICGLVR